MALWVIQYFWRIHKMKLQLAGGYTHVPKLGEKGFFSLSVVLILLAASAVIAFRYQVWNDCIGWELAVPCAAGVLTIFLQNLGYGSEATSAGDEIDGYFAGAVSFLMSAAPGLTALIHLRGNWTRNQKTGHCLATFGVGILMAFCNFLNFGKIPEVNERRRERHDELRNFEWENEVTREEPAQEDPYHGYQFEETDSMLARFK
jgi:hypothetical protein